MNNSPHTIINIELPQHQNNPQQIKTAQQSFKVKFIEGCKTISGVLFFLASILTLINFTIVHWQSWNTIRTMQNTCLHPSWDNTNYINTVMMLTFTAVPVFTTFLLVVYGKCNYFRTANSLVNYLVPDCESFPRCLNWTVKAVLSISLMSLAAAITLAIHILVMKGVPVFISGLDIKRLQFKCEQPIAFYFGKMWFFYLVPPLVLLIALVFVLVSYFLSNLGQHIVLKEGASTPVANLPLDSPV